MQELSLLEAQLDKWYNALPDHLRYEPASRRPLPAPHIIMLHLDYWCTVLLLHRPLSVGLVLHLEFLAHILVTAFG